MDSDDFYVMVPSNSPSASGKPNMPQDFTVAVQHSEQLQGKWEVALTEIHYPNTWFNLRKDAVLKATAVHVQDGTPMSPPEFITIPAGYYESLDKLITTINANSKEIRAYFSPSEERVWITNRISKKVDLRVTEESVELLSILGFRAKRFTAGNLENMPVLADFKPSLKFHLPAMYIYCNFIDHQYVGNEKAPLLRIVPTTNTDQKKGFIAFQLLYYMGLSTGYINSLHFEIRDNTAELIQFQSGEIILGLHFRRKRI